MKKSIKCGIVAAVAVAAGFAAYQSYGSYGAQNNNLLMQNVEALAQSTNPNEPGGDIGSGTPTTYEGCLAQGGQWGQISQFVDKETWVVEGTGGFTVKCGDKEYGVNWSTKRGERKKWVITKYRCVGDGLSGDKRNCCLKQGVYHGDEKLG